MFISGGARRLTRAPVSWLCWMADVDSATSPKQPLRFQPTSVLTTFLSWKLLHKLGIRSRILLALPETTVKIQTSCSPSTSRCQVCPKRRQYSVGGYRSLDLFLLLVGNSRVGGDQIGFWVKFVETPLDALRVKNHGPSQERRQESFHSNGLWRLGLARTQIANSQHLILMRVNQHGLLGQRPY